MTTSIFKSLFAGILLGSMLFFMPGCIMAFFLIFFFAKLIFFSRMRRYAYFSRTPMYYADQIRNLTDEEYESFKNNMPGMAYLPKSKRK